MKREEPLPAPEAGVAAWPPAWRRALPALAFVVAGLLLLYRDTALAMVEIWWRSATFQHAFLVAPLSLWLAWRLRGRLATLTPRPQPTLLAVLALAAAVWLVGDLAAANVVTQAMLVLMLVASVPAMLGLRVAWELAFPLAFLFFMVPAGDFLLPTLMDATADFTVSALQLTGVPVYREGRQFIIPTGSWSVVEACSGVRYLIASVMVGTLFAYLNYRSAARRWAFVAVSVVVPVVANWLRAYIIVMLGHLSNNRIAAGVDHLIYGWIFFGVVIVAMFFIGARWAQPAEVADAQGAQGAPAAAGPGAPAAVLWSTAVLALAVAGTAPALRWRFEHAAEVAAPALHWPASLPGGWTLAASANAGGSGYKPHFEGASLELGGAYTDGRRSVEVYLAYYRGQRYGRKLVSSENALVRSEDHEWNQVARGLRSVDGVDWRTGEVLGGASVGHPDQRRLDVRQVYWVDGRLLASEARASVAGALGRLQGRGDDAAALIVFAEGREPAATQATLDAFTHDTLPALTGWLNEERKRQ